MSETALDLARAVAIGSWSVVAMFVAIYAIMRAWYAIKRRRRARAAPARERR